MIRLAGTIRQDSRHLKAKASIRPAADTGWVLSLATEFDGVSGERTLTGISCDSLSDAAALVLALLMNPDLAASPPQVASPQTTVVQSTPQMEKPAHAVWQAGAYAGVQTGVIEDASPSFMLSLGVVLGRLSFHVLPGFTPPQDVRIPNTQPQVGGRLWLATVDALGCWAPANGPAALRTCLGFDVTRLQGRGLGVMQASEKAVYWSSAELAVWAGLHVSRRMLLEIGGIAQLPLHRPRVTLDEIGAVSRPARFGFKALGGLAWVFE